MPLPHDEIKRALIIRILPFIYSFSQLIGTTLLFA